MQRLSHLIRPRLVGLGVLLLAVAACRTSAGSKVADAAAEPASPAAAAAAAPAPAGPTWQCRTRTVTLQFNEGLTISQTDQGYNAHFKFQRTPGPGFETDVPVTRQAGGLTEAFNGPSFTLHINLESFAPTTKHPANLTFSNGSDRYDGPLVCTKLGSGPQGDGQACTDTTACQSGLTCCPQGGGTVPTGVDPPPQTKVCLQVQGPCPLPP